MTKSQMAHRGYGLYRSISWIGVVSVISLNVLEYLPAYPLTDQSTRRSIGAIPNLS